MKKKQSPAEVTRTSVRPRGSPPKKETVVVENVSSTTKLKRNILYATATMVHLAGAIAIAAGWEPEYIHVAHAAYPLAINYVVQMLTIRFIS